MDLLLAGFWTLRLARLGLWLARAPRFLHPRRQTTKFNHPQYAALSYCWGNPSVASTQITTTKNTEVAHQTGIQMEALTQTLREAVTVCRSLDIPYLWVDAMCILQDDDDDWNQQCVDMCNI
jgi:hypothetical protein